MPSASSQLRTVPTPANWLMAGTLIVLGALAVGLMLQTVFENPLLAQACLSQPTWMQLMHLGGARLVAHAGGEVTAELSLTLPFVGVLGVAILGWLGGTLGLSRGTPGQRGNIAIAWGVRGWRWWLLGAVWWGAWMLAILAGWADVLRFLAGSWPLWLTLLLNLAFAEWFALRRELRGCCLLPGADEQSAERNAWRALAACIVLYTVVFTAMNWGLWFNLQIPHGDSAMYEEHLWNLEHGKGFRSYLDQGLFLGEHLQVIHVLLVPLHLLWPSHLLLEFCESLALGLTAVPVYCIARRHSGSARAALYLSAAVLLYFPLQMLDISIDFKTFRPSAFGIPLLVAAIDQMERRRWKRMGILLLLTLSAQEDFAIPISLLGFWLVLTADRRPGQTTDDHSRTARVIGAAMWLGAAAYLWLALKVIIPWFRDGATVHYARYFSAFGETPGEILQTILFNPGLVMRETLNASTFLWGMLLLAPLGFLPILSPGRLALGLPLFGLLCLNELAQDPPGPFHHFHAPLLPLLFWAAAAGLGRLRGPSGLPAAAVAGSPQAEMRPPAWNTAICGARFALGCALLGGVCYTLSPLGTRFWDNGRIVAGRPTYWRALYLPDARARAWSDVADLIPRSARVASTDFVHPRLTHHERSYDYSGYARRVAGYANQVPDDTDYIVIDLQHAYSRDVLGNVSRAADVRELRDSPEQWDLLTDPENPYFVVLRRAR